MTFEPDLPASADRMYVWERDGRVWIVENGVTLSQPLIDISEEVGAWRDFGLLGFALDPSFRQNGYVYLAYVVDYHHLKRFGTSAYRASSNEFFTATISRVTRYTARASDGFRSIDYSTRKVLLGESITNGVPSMHRSHGIGAILFGTDGTLLVSCGDGASFTSVDTGSAEDTYYEQALTDGIIRQKENVGSFRAQLVDSLNGKILRLDPETGDGVPGNPFYDPARPRAARSRVWCLGIRNSYRVTLRPGTGSHNRADANPGVLYMGDVGWETYEDLNIATGPGQNFGWPLYEGLQAMPDYMDADVFNRDAPNPLTGSKCKQYFYFRDLLVQDTLNTPSWPNPCSTGQQIPASIPRFVHRRPVIEWKHETGPARTGTYTSGGSASVINVGASGSPVSGSSFGGTSSIGGTWYGGNDFPAEYKNTYFHGDFEGEWIRSFVFDTNNKPVSVRPFLENGGWIVAIATHPANGGLYYASWSNGVRRIRYGGNQPPKAFVTADKSFGPAPLAVFLDGSASTDPELSPLRYHWSFGDGSHTSTNPSVWHVFSAPAGMPTRYVVTLTVTDASNATAQATVGVSVNNTPPLVTIVSPVDGTRYPLTNETVYPLAAAVSDDEHGPAQLAYAWTTTLHHNNHIHTEPLNTNRIATTVISPVGCDGATYFYSVALTVTDSAGLSGTDTVFLYPDCPRDPKLTYLGRNQSGQLRWQLAGESNRTYRIEASTNLSTWTTLTNLQPVSTTAEFVSAALSPCRFFRAIKLP